ncbi:hypothetical protein MMB92_17950 [Burkholderia sp. IO2]|uniref:hypothetical protein n=1 Tax=Burkholderia sp. IO2 TaxID=2917805 RepID=UPI002404D4D3|nr:hypothetical protein [Burkholderia sp. IO2]MDG0065848.1 hypothetical protein [Burkholderia sp. IO2]
MLLARNLSDRQPIQYVRSRHTDNLYSPNMSLRQFVTAPLGLDYRIDWMVTFEQGTSDSLDESIVAEVVEVPARLSATQKWQRLVFDPSASVDVDDLSETVGAVYEAIDTFGPSVVSFEHIEAAAVQGEHLAVALRATSPWRDEIAGWHAALQTARMALENSGVPPEDALYGLIDI